ncbi:hypothetical protein QWY77_09490 [Thalassotalea ponticola]|uniref:hypothetical protein n=1 Tax=Thalassotalea ponticola TaxID=1523392 RepID=UPI0025B4FBA3|nr:hypothetical protein [Thalassotalea ponticola]MDN3652990.1 hypothetical protein [Thalassotalea ponticola]
MTILDQQVPLTHNLKFALQNHRFLWLLLLFTAGLDYISTIEFMTHGSIAHEGNLIVRTLAYQLGILPGVAVGKLLQILAAMAFCALTKEMARPIMMIIIALNICAFYINTSY